MRDKVSVLLLEFDFLLLDTLTLSMMTVVLTSGERLWCWFLWCVTCRRAFSIISRSDWLFSSVNQCEWRVCRCGFCDSTYLVEFLLRYHIKGLFTCRRLVSLFDWWILTTATWWCGDTTISFTLFGPKTSGLLVLLHTYVHTYVLCLVCVMYIWFGNVTYEQDWWWSNMKSCVTPSSSCTHTYTHRPRVTLMNEIRISPFL